MAAGVDPPRTPRVSDIPSSAPAITAEGNRSIDAYLGAGDGMAGIMGVTMMVCAALLVLVAVAWIIGVLPGAVKLF